MKGATHYLYQPVTYLGGEPGNAHHRRHVGDPVSVIGREPDGAGRFLALTGNGEVIHCPGASLRPVPRDPHHPPAVQSSSDP